MSKKVVVDNNGLLLNKRPMSLQQRLQSVTVDYSQEEKTQDKKIEKQYSSYVTQYLKYQVNENSFFIIRFGLVQLQGRIIVVDQEQIDQIQQGEKHWVKFRMWNYKEQLQWKDKSLKYNHQSKSFVINNQILNEIKLRNLIKDWSFAEYSDKYKLLHVNKYLSDESYEIFKGFFPNIINEIIRKMNLVLQNNG